MELKPGYKQTDVGVIPNDWDGVRISQVSEMITVGFVGSMAHLFTKQGIPLLRGQNILPNMLDLTETRFISESTHRLWNKSSLKHGDVVLVRVGYPGTACVIPPYLGEANAASLVVVRPSSKKLNPMFLSHMVNSDFGKYQIQSYLVGGAQQVFNTKTAAIFKLPLPSLAEQQVIAEALSDADALIESLEQLIAKKRQIKQGAMQELLTGKKRQPGFKEKWKACSLSDIGIFSKGKGIKKDDVTSEGIPCIRYGEIYTHHNDYIKEYHSFIPLEITDQSRRIKKGDLLFTGSGETAEGIGKCVAFLGDDEIYAGGDVVIMTPVHQDSKYLGYLMNHSSISIQKARMAQGDAIVHISAQKLGQLQLHIPPVAEQTAIAAILSDMDTEISSLELKLAKTRQIKQGMMQELLTGRIRLI